MILIKTSTSTGREGRKFRQYGSIGYDLLKLNNFWCRQSGGKNYRMVGLAHDKRRKKHSNIALLFLGQWVGGEILNTNE